MTAFLWKQPHNKKPQPKSLEVIFRSTLSPAPQTGSAYQSDPLAFFTPPTSSSCTYTNFSVSGSANQTLSPGTYCNGIVIANGAKVTFQSGAYILMGGGLNVSGATTITGSGVTFFDTAGLGYTYKPITISGTVVMSLTAPASGPYQGLLFWQDRNIPSGQAASSVNGTSSSALAGVFYFPTTGLAYSGTPANSNGSCVMLVADTITFGGTTALKDNSASCSSLLPPVGVTLSPSAATLYPSQTQQFTATVSNTINTAVTWSISPSSAGSIGASGLYTAPSTIAAQQTVTVTATSQADPTKSASATVTLMPPIAVSVNPPRATLYGGQTQQFTSTVINTNNTAVTWSISPAIGTISSSGLYTAPSAIASQQTVTVTATSQADPTKAGSAMVTLMPPITVSITPASATLHAAQTQQFSATVTNTSNTAVTWSLSPVGMGTITAAGLYTAPASIAAQETVTVTAASQADTSKFASAIVTLASAAPSSELTLSPRITGPNVVGTQQTLTAVLMSGIRAGATPIGGVAVQFTVTGPNASTGTATTDATGTAIFTYTGANSGSDTVQASYGSVVSNDSFIGWVVPNQPISTTTALGQFFPLYGPCCAFTATPANTPAFTQTFPTINFDPPSGSIPGNTTIGDATQPFTDVTLDKNGNFSGTIVAQGNGYQAWTGALRAFQAVFTGSFIVANEADIVIPVFVDNAFVLGIGGGASVTPPTNQVTPFNQYPVMEALSTSIGGTSVKVHFPGPGTYPYELDFVEDGFGLVSLMMTAGTPGSSGLAPSIPSGGTLTLSPNSVQTQPAGGQQSFTVAATDAGGNPAPNLDVSLVVSLNDTQQLSAVTDSSGTATFSYQNIEPGTDNVQAVAIIDGMVAYSNIVTVPWGTSSGGSGSTPPPPTTPPDIPVVNSGWIGSPANGSTVSGIVPITVPSGTTLTSGTLSYASASTPNNLITLNASVSGSGQIGTLDTTTLSNGGYWIELDAVSSTGAPMVSLELITVAGDYKPGRITTTQTDLVVPTTGLAIRLDRRYDSLNSNQSGDFGFGWSLGTSIDFAVSANNDVTLTIGGQRRTFYFTPQAISWLLPFLVVPAYTPEAGMHGTLATTGDNCGGILERVQGTIVCDFGLTGTRYQPAGYIYTDTSGTRYTIRRRRHARIHPGSGGQYAHHRCERHYQLDRAECAVSARYARADHAHYRSAGK